MKEAFNEEKALVAKVMGFDQNLSWMEIYDKMAEAITPFEDWLRFSTEEQDVSTKAIILLPAVRYFTHYHLVGIWSEGAYCKTRARLNGAITDLFLKGYLSNLEKQDLYGVVDDDLLEKHALLLCK